MNSQKIFLLKAALAVAVALVAGKFLLTEIHSFRASGEEDARVWFYDLSRKRLYAAARDTIPPDQSIRGNGGGVRAIVVAFQNNERDADKLKIAYLETYTPELKALLERFFLARAARKVFTEALPARNSEYFQTNTLVKRLDDDAWQTSGSAEGRTIMSEWRSWHGPQGERPLVSVP